MFRRDANVWEKGSARRGPWRWWLWLVVLALLIAGGVALFHEERPVPVTPRKAASVVQAPVAMTPAPDTEFTREEAMSPHDLMMRWDPLVTEASKKLKVPPEWIRAVITKESGGRTLMGENMPIISSMGAMGIMQVLPETYADMKVEYGLGDDPYDPHDNVIAGTAYLKFLYAKYGNPGMFAAYNDGPGNLETFLSGGRELPDETHNYVNGISKMLGQPQDTLGRLTVAEFTRPDGSKFEIDARNVSGVRAAFAGEYAPGVQSVITLGKARQGVQENVAAVTASLKAHGAKY